MKIWKRATNSDKPVQQQRIAAPVFGDLPKSTVFGSSKKQSKLILIISGAALLAVPLVSAAINNSKNKNNSLGADQTVSVSADNKALKLEQTGTLGLDSQPPTGGSSNSAVVRQRVSGHASVSTNQPQTSTQVSVNGETINIPPNGSYKKVTNNPDGSQTVVNVESSQNSSSTNFSSSVSSSTSGGN